MQHINPNELNTTLTPHSMIHGDACFAYFNKIWGIPGVFAGSGWLTLSIVSIFVLFSRLNVYPRVSFFCIFILGVGFSLCTLCPGRFAKAAVLTLTCFLATIEAIGDVYRQDPRMSRSLLNIAKRPLPRLTLRGVSLTSKDAVS